RPGSAPSCRRWRNRAGSSDATCGSTPAGPQPIPPTFADTRRNWPRSRSVAPSLRVEVHPLKKRDAGEIERAVAAFAPVSNGGLIVTAGGPAQLHRDLIITLAARHKLPAVYFDRAFVAAGGLLSYGPDRIDMYRRAAGYIDRILKGEKPADLPVQAPTK